jgi:hypothetical protein
VPDLGRPRQPDLRDFSAAAPLVNVALAGGARLTATMA